MDPIARARINASLRETLADLLTRQVKDPRVENVTVTGVEVTTDLSRARVWFSVLGSEEQRRVAQRGLQNVAGYLRREIGRRLHLRTAPELRFEFDASLEHGQRIETLLREWHDEGAAGPPPGRDDEEKS
jgi:ribosome-binding factor A